MTTAVESRGQRLTRELLESGTSPDRRVLAEEAGRLADRLDRLDKILAGEGEWLTFDARDYGSDVRVTVTVDHVLAEARQHATALKQLVAELRATSGSKPVGRAPAGAQGGAGRSAGGNITDLAAKLAARRDAAKS